MVEMSSSDKSITAVVAGTADDEYLCVNVSSNPYAYCSTGCKEILARTTDCKGMMYACMKV